MDAYLIGFDLGTSAIKAVLTDHHGSIIAKSVRTVELVRSAELRCEFDAERYFDQIVSMLAELSDAAPNRAAVRAMSFCAASGNTVLLDEHFKPVRPVISWLDERAKAEAADLLPGLDTASVRERVGWGWSGGFPLAHLAWLKAHEPDSWRRARYFAMNNDYLYYRLCGRLVVDPSKATTFYLRDQVAGTWSLDYLEMLGIDSASLPEVIDSGRTVGTLDARIASITGLPAEAQIVAGSFDHPGAARSTGIFSTGDLLISAGTSWVAFAPIRERALGIEHEMLVDPFLSPDGCWGALFALTAIANRIDAILEVCLPEDQQRYRQFDSLAARSVPGAEGLLINPCEQSVQEILEEGSEFEPAALMRAVMEGCVFLMKHRISRLERILDRPMKRIVMVGGPTKSPIWPQILADALGYSLILPESGSHAGALGAAALAGIGAGIYRDERDAFDRAGREKNRVERVIEPEAASTDRYQRFYARFVDRFGLLQPTQTK